MTELQSPPIPSLLDLSATELAVQIASGAISSVAATEACIQQILAVNPRINAVIFPLFAEARIAAQSADAAVASGQPLGPLHGVPITIKEQFEVRDTPATWGVKQRAHERAATDGPLVARLRAAGAIILGKTNVPQLLFFNETDNPLYGRTNNPWNLERSPGGSSGGEGAILAARGSFFGLGSDIGGSLRIPAHYCGIASLKPTSHRLTGLDNPNYFHSGQEAIPSASGPMARTVADVALGYSILAAPGQELFDSTVPPVPAGDPSAINPTKLKVAYYMDDGFFPSSLAVQRGVREAVASLQEQGITVEAWSPPNIVQGMALFISLLGADAGFTQQRSLAGEKPVPQLAALFQAGNLPNSVRPLVKSLLHVTGQHSKAQVIPLIQSRNTAAYWDLCRQRSIYRAQFLAEMTAKGFDAIICPPHALPAVTHGATESVAFAASYSMIFNLLGMPAGIVPVTRVLPSEEGQRRPTRDTSDKVAAKVDQGSSGLPIGVQVVARHWREDIVLALMGLIEASARKQPNFPLRPSL